MEVVNGINVLMNENITAATVPPTKPHSVSITGTLASFTERDNVTFICIGNVGKPPGKFIWRKRRDKNNFPVFYTNTKTNYTKLDESCSYEGMSALTITLTDKDNQAIISCAEESLMSNDAMFKYTLPIDIFFKAQTPSIMKYPNRSMYMEGIEIILLTCISNGNPSPTYLWYFNGTSIHAGSVLEIKNIRESESGQYFCNASNSFHGTLFEASHAVNISVIKNTENSGTSSTNLSGTEGNTMTK
ncbi:CD166 antigen-like [Mytilus edulis]|uniref:CD166 antigen-like n=1 Tax=Mytilus edulis TaxID=6550 RepID=UPI0039F073E2